MSTNHQDLTFLTRCTAVNIQCHSLSFTKKLPRAVVTTMVQTAENAAQATADEASAAEQVSGQAGDDGPATGEQRRSDPNRIGASKKLLDCNEAEAIKSEFSRLKKFIASKTLPTPFGKGIYFVPNTFIGEIDAELTIARDQTVPRLCNNLLAVYSDVLRREQEALGANFDPRDYDTPEEVRARLGIEFSYLTFGVPQNLPENIFARESEKQRNRLVESVDMMQTLLRSEMAKLVNHAVEKLQGKKDGGKPLTFKNTLIGNIREFLAVFNDRNITDDADMKALCDRAAQLLEGVDPQDLRDKEPLRESVAAGFAEIQAQLDTMLVPRGSRVIEFDDDEPTPAAAAEPAQVSIETEPAGEAAAA